MSGSSLPLGYKGISQVLADTQLGSVLQAAAETAAEKAEAARTAAEQVATDSAVVAQKAVLVEQGRVAVAGDRTAVEQARQTASQAAAAAATDRQQAQTAASIAAAQAGQEVKAIIQTPPPGAAVDLSLDTLVGEIWVPNGAGGYDRRPFTGSALAALIDQRIASTVPPVTLNVDLAGSFPTDHLTLARASTGMARNAAGLYSSFAANAPRVTDRGLFIEDAPRTNSLVNNSMTGANVGTNALPTGWTEGFIAAGITRTVVAVGTHPTLGLPYIRLRYSGTCTTSQRYELRMTYGGTANVAAGAANGLWCVSAWMARVDEPVALPPTARPALQCFFVTSGNVTTGGTANVSYAVLKRDTTPVRRHVISKPTPADAAFLRVNWACSFAVGVAYDFTVDIIAPQVEAVAADTDGPSSPILTTNAAATRAADVVTVKGGLLEALQYPAATLRVTTAGMPQTRTAHNLVAVNGGTALLRRSPDGGLSSGLGNQPTTARGYRPNYSMPQESTVTWGSGAIRVGGSGCAEMALGTGEPAIASATLGGMGATISRIKATNLLSDLSAYKRIDADMLVYGANPGGITAAVEMRRQGRSAAILGGWREIQLGGMVTGGLAAVDVANLAAYGGLSADYVAWTNEATGQNLTNIFVEPKHASSFFDWLLTTYGIPVYWSRGVQLAAKAANRITSLATVDGKTATGRVFIDATYEGDVLPKAGVSYVTGREAATTDDPYNGFRNLENVTTAAGGQMEHIFANPRTGAVINVDPYVTPGNPASGLLHGVRVKPNLVTGAADGRTQAYTFRMTLTEIAANKVALPSLAPAGYSKARYELFLRMLAAYAAAGLTYIARGTEPAAGQYGFGDLFKANGGNLKDFNSKGGFSIDYFGGSWEYPEADYATREVIWKDHEAHVRGFWYLLQYETDSRIPAQLQTDARAFGLALDHYNEPHPNDDAHWMPQLYVREARRMRSEMVWTVADMNRVDGTAPRSSRTISAGSYDSDSHHVQRFAQEYATGQYRTVCEGGVLDQNTGGADRVFPMPYEAIIPRTAECSNLGVTFCASTTHTAFGSFRMEMASMASGQALGVAAALAVEAPQQLNMNDVDYTALRTRLLAGGQVVPATN
jgi:hypothetical protein